MNMTHYMELLAANQPWNLIIYMLIPVALAEALVATEFFVVFKRAKTMDKCCAFLRPGAAGSL